MFVRIHAGLLALALAQAPAVLAEDMIRVSVEEGKKRTEFRLNGNLECVLENQRITCVPVSQ